MNLVLTVLALGSVAIVIVLVGWSQRNRQDADLGVVSHQWLAEHRHSQTQDTHR